MDLWMVVPWIMLRRMDEFAMNTINSRSVFGSHVQNTTLDYDDSKGNVILLDKTKNIHVEHFSI